MKDWKTTVSGVVIGVAMALKALGIDIPEEVLNGVIALAAAALGYFAKQTD